MHEVPGSSKRGDRGRGDKRMKLYCEELSKAVTCFSWVQGRSISHLPGNLSISD